jgi:cytidylate kinase
MRIPNIISIDGPAASGKSTLGKNLAEVLNYLYFDTGVMYRAITWVALQCGIRIDSEEKINHLAENISIDVRPPSKDDGRDYDVWVNGQDITWDIRRPEIDANVSVVSAYSGVRRALTEQQRRIGLRGRVVMVGRDIGTVVLPEANLKIYLDASVEVRARRRYEEMLERTDNFMAQEDDRSLDAILAAMRKRDQIDSTRQIAPLKPAEDAVTIDSNHLDADQVLEKAKELVYHPSFEA